MPHHLCQPDLADAQNKLLRAESTFGGGAPHVDAPGFQDEDPAVNSAEVFPQEIERELVVRSHDDGRIRTGCPRA